MPYPTEHVAKIESVAGFNLTTLLRRKLGGGISVIVGNRQDDDTKVSAQSYRFESKRFSPDAARKWIKDHDAKILSFEPATNEDSVIKNVAAIMAQTGVEAGLVVNEDGVTAAAKDDVVGNAGTSEGAKKGWDKRGRGQKGGDVGQTDREIDIGGSKFPVGVGSMVREPGAPHSRQIVGGMKESGWITKEQDGSEGWLDHDEAKKQIRHHEIMIRATTNAEDNSRACLVHNLGKLTRVEQHDGIDYLVAPTVLICEGVHNNLYYPPEELAKFCDAWNGRPVVVFHPQTSGKAVTANSPAVWWGKGGSKVGYVFNTRWDAAAGKLRADIYVDPVKCREAGQHGKQAIDTLESEGPLEVSTGLFTELRMNAGGDVEAGEWKGEQYRGVAINHRPDHLALLPGLKGACSWDDGAGAPRVNAEANTEGVVENAGTSEGAKKAWDTRGRGQAEEQSVASKFASPDEDRVAAARREKFKETFKLTPEEKKTVEELKVTAASESKNEWRQGNSSDGNSFIELYAGTGGAEDVAGATHLFIVGKGIFGEAKGKFEAQVNRLVKKSGGRKEWAPRELKRFDTAAEAIKWADSKAGSKPNVTEKAQAFSKIYDNASYTLNADGVMVNAELSHSQLNETLYKLISARFTPESVAQPGNNPSPCAGPYLVDVYDDCAIFTCDNKTWRIEYTSGDESVALDDGPAQEVQRVMSYEPVVNETCEFDDDEEDDDKDEEGGMETNAGTSEGAKKAWDTRGRGQKEKEKSVASKFAGGKGKESAKDATDAGKMKAFAVKWAEGSKKELEKAIFDEVDNAGGDASSVNLKDLVNEGSYSFIQSMSDDMHEEMNLSPDGEWLIAAQDDYNDAVAGALNAAEKILLKHGRDVLRGMRNNENNEATGDTGPHNNEEISMKDEGNKKASTAGASVANAAPAAPVINTPETLETVLAGIKDNGLRTLVTEGVETMKQEKAKLVEKLVVNGAFTKDELDAMALAGLRKLDLALTKAATPVVNEQSAAGAVRVAAGAAPVVNNSDKNGVPPMPGLFEKK